MESTLKYQVYVGCALTTAPQSFRDTVAAFKIALAAVRDSKREFEILEFVGLENGTAQEVYDHDLGNVEQCHVMIAFVEEPSIGLGIELATAIRLEKPILCLHRPESRVTRMLFGARDKHLLAIMPYDGIDDAVSIAWGFITYQEIVCGKFNQRANA